MKKTLRLDRQTIRNLTTNDLSRAQGADGLIGGSLLLSCVATVAESVCTPCTSGTAPTVKFPK